jgi:hypothetical protein
VSQSKAKPFFFSQQFWSWTNSLLYRTTKKPKYNGLFCCPNGLTKEDSPCGSLVPVMVWCCLLFRSKQYQIPITKLLKTGPDRLSYRSYQKTHNYTPQRISILILPRSMRVHVLPGFIFTIIFILRPSLVSKFQSFRNTALDRATTASRLCEGHGEGLCA